MARGESTISSFNKVLRFDANEATMIILSAVVNDARRCLIGSDAKVVDVVQRLLTSHYQRLMNQTAKLSRIIQ